MTIALADYLLTRLRQLGVDSIHGVPGDYNLELLDHVEDQGFNWVGNCNELNAGYAADGYARIKGAAALITTFGVGELSAINAIAGAYTELAPVIHIVGMPVRQSQTKRALIHHTLLDGEYTHFSNMAEHVTVAQAILQDPRTCPAQIDNAIQQCLLHSRPVYITVPADMVKTLVDSSLLAQPITLPSYTSSGDTEAQALSYVQERISKAHSPLILVDGESRAYGIVDLIDEMVQKTAWPTWTTAFGKGLVNEQLPNVMGVWQGRFAPESHQDCFRNADLILCFGPHFSGTNTYLYSGIPEEKTTILFQRDSIKASDKMFRDLPALRFLQQLLSHCSEASLHKTLSLPPRPQSGFDQSAPQSAAKIDQISFYRYINQFLRPGDIIFGETGTAGYGCRDLVLPEGCRITLPATWLSIGYMLPAAQGAALAQRELHQKQLWITAARGEQPRTILIIGDGSVQMTVQEISTMIQHKLNITIIVINNNGYTIEKCIHGPNRAYNGVAAWRYLAAPDLFNLSRDEDAEYPAITAQASTYEEVAHFFHKQQSVHRPCFSMLEVMMREKDAPVPLLRMLNVKME